MVSVSDHLWHPSQTSQDFISDRKQRYISDRKKSIGTLDNLTFVFIILLIHLIVFFIAIISDTSFHLQIFRWWTSLCACCLGPSPPTCPSSTSTWVRTTMSGCCPPSSTRSLRASLPSLMPHSSSHRELRYSPNPHRYTFSLIWIKKLEMHSFVSHFIFLMGCLGVSADQKGANRKS